MATRPSRFISKLQSHLELVTSGPQSLAFMSAFLLAAFWWGGETVFVSFALLFPLLLLLLNPSDQRRMAIRNSKTGLLGRPEFEMMVDKVWQDTKSNQKESLLLLLELDDFSSLFKQHGQKAADLVATRVGQRIIDALRENDLVSRTGDACFAICLAPQSRLDLEIAIQTVSRLQAAIEEPIALDGTTVYMSCAAGFCLSSRAPENGGDAWMSAVRTALLEASQRGPSTIRAFSHEMHAAKAQRNALRDEAAEALESGHIQPWFQPQVSTDTGKVTGFEALARWVHPKRGIVPPIEFLPALEEAGLMERLSEVMMYHTFTALNKWNEAGLSIPHVGVNFSNSELRNPRLVDKISWELDRFNLAPDRLSIEVLETVVTSAPDDIVCRNLNGLSALGCRIDLDDFGTGNASIAAIRRFSVSRIKIDRSFVMKADRDPEQQRMISAILMMAERLHVETLAEGVETVGEHALLGQLGCDHVQGFGIGKPMPFDQTVAWVAAHEAKLVDAPQIGGRRSS